VKNFETIRNPEFREAAVEGERPTNFFASKYYKKRVKQLRSLLEKVRPFDPKTEGLIVVGTALRLDEFKALPEVTKEEEMTTSVHESAALSEAPSFVQATIDTRRLFFRTSPQETKGKSVIVTNVGTTAIYYRWETARELELTVGSGAGRVPVKGPNNAEEEGFDWFASDSLNVPKNIPPKTKSEFSFPQTSGSIRPGGRAVFNITFKSDVPGCFIQRWIMRITPTPRAQRQLSVSLRGCCEVEPPDLKAFKQSIDNSLHESERTRCIDEIMAAVFDRVSKMCAMRGRPTDEPIESDLLVDDRAPVFEAANKRWGLVYSPAVYTSLLRIANEIWDAAGVSGFDRFWDMSVESLTDAAMRLRDGAIKRDILERINTVIKGGMTVSAAGSLSFSLAFVQLATYLDQLPALFLRDAALLGVGLPLFTVPKLPDPAALEEALESTHRRHRRRQGKPTPPVSARRSRRNKDDEPARPPTDPKELSPELRAAVRATIREELKKKLLAFENLATESQGVGQQLTRVNEIERLDTDLDPEVDDDL
jgi:hypothetical protein